jgi:glycerol uptake facilitator-like aquaporin
VGILFGNTILVSLIISATLSATGGHVNSIVTMATAFSGLFHPVRAIIYIFCQLAGGALGGTLLRVALGKKKSYEIHNAACWIEPKGEVDIWQAVLIEFTSSFILLLVIFPSPIRINRTY